MCCNGWEMVRRRWTYLTRRELTVVEERSKGSTGKDEVERNVAHHLLHADLLAMEITEK